MYFQASEAYDPDSPCVYLSVLAHLNRVALSDGSFSLTLKLLFWGSVVAQLVKLVSLNAWLGGVVVVGVVRILTEPILYIKSG